MSVPSDYFVNHARGTRFPWSLYHRPLEQDLARFLREVAQAKPSAEVLVIGCGLMHELADAPAGIRFTPLDTDARALAAVAARGDPRIMPGIQVDAGTRLESLGRTFDAVYAKEVIEHVVPWEPYLAQLRQILRPGGRVWLSTPNYGEPWLALLERTVLELIARRSGYSRKDIHPSRLSREVLEQGLVRSGFTEVTVEVTSRRLALVAHAWA